MDDLFTSKKQQLINFLRDKHYFSKADVAKWGIDNYYLCSVRRMQEMAQDGKIRRLSKDECLMRGFKGKMGYYEWRSYENMQEEGLFHHSKQVQSE